MLPKGEEGAWVSSHSFHSSASDPHGGEERSSCPQSQTANSLPTLQSWWVIFRVRINIYACYALHHFTSVTNFQCSTIYPSQLTQCKEALIWALGFSKNKNNIIDTRPFTLWWCILSIARAHILLGYFSFLHIICMPQTYNYEVSKNLNDTP